MNPARSARLCRLLATALLILSLSTAVAATGTWNLDADGNWNNSANWTPGPFPNASGDDATFGNVITANRTITLGANLNVRSLTFNATHAYNITGANTLTLNLQETTGANLVQSGAGAVTFGFTTLTLKQNSLWNGNGAGIVTINSVVDDGKKHYTVTKSGSFTLVLNAANVFDGGLLLQSGTIQLGNDAANGAGPMTISGGTIMSIGGARIINEALTIGGDFTIGGALDFNFAGTTAIATTRVITTSNTGNSIFSGVVSGAGGITKAGGGTLTLSGSANNTYSGVTTVNDGTLQLNMTTGKNAFGGTLTVGDGVGAANSAITRFLATNEIPVVAVTINSDGLFDLNNFSDAIGAVTTTGGSITTGSGTLTLGGTVTGNASAATATISGNLALGANRIFDIADGAASTDMLVSALVSGAFSVTKNGSGSLVFSNANTYTGSTTVNGGDLSISTFTLSPTGVATIAASSTLTSTGVLNLNPSTTVAQTLITGAGTLQLRNTTSTALAPDIYYDPAGGAGAGYQVTIASNVDVGTGTRFVNGKSNRNDFERYGGDLVFGGNLTGSANLNFNGTPNTAAGGPWQVAYVFQGNNASFTGGVTLTDGANLILSNNSALSSANAVTFTPATSAVSGLYLNGHNVTIGALSGTSAGTMNIRNGALTTDTNVWITKSNSTLTVQQSTNTTFGGTISDGPNDHGIGDAGTYYTLGLIKSGSGSLTLSGTNTYSGGTTINGGTLVVNSTASLGASTGGLTINAGTLEVATGYSTTRTITLGNAASTFQIDASQTFTDTTAIGGTGSLTKTGAGTMVLGATETYSGGTNVSAGTLQLNASNRIPDASAVTVSGGSLDVQTFTDTVGVVTLSGGSIIGSGAGAVAATNYALQSGSASAILAGSGTVTKSTSGTVTLTGANTMSGAVTVSAGTLMLAASSGSALGSVSSVTVNSGGTILLGASDQINNSASVTLGGGTLAKGTFSEGSTGAVGLGALTLNATGSKLDFGTGTVGVLSFASFSPSSNVLLIDNWTGTANTVGSGSTDRLIFDTNQSGNLGSFWFTGYAPGATEFALGGGFYELTPTAVPEPSTWAAGLLSFAGMIYWHLGHRRRQLQLVKSSWSRGTSSLS